MQRETEFGSNEIIGLGKSFLLGRQGGRKDEETDGHSNALLTNAVNTPGGIATAGSAPDWNLPKVEAAYLLKFGGFDVRPFGGVQYFKVSEGASVLTDDLEILSCVLGFDSRLNSARSTSPARLPDGRCGRNRPGVLLVRRRQVADRFLIAPLR